MDTTLPRNCRRACGVSPTRLPCPPKSTSPAVMRPMGKGNKPMIDKAVMLLPQPLSPTSPTVSPLPTANEMPSTTFTAPPGSASVVRRPSTVRTGEPVVMQGGA